MLNVYECQKYIYIYIKQHSDVWLLLNYACTLDGEEALLQWRRAGAIPLPSVLGCMQPTGCGLDMPDLTFMQTVP